MTAPSPRLDTFWFDGQRPTAWPATIWFEGDVLVMRTATPPERGEQRHPRAAVRWPERSRHGQRQAQLPDGSLLQHPDAPAWDAWWRASGGRESPVVRWQQSWRSALAAVVGSVLLLGALWQWGVPLLSRELVRAVPTALETRLGETALESLRGHLLQPSQIPPERQAAIRARFAALVQRAMPVAAPAWRLHVYRSDALGANAFALPGGDMVVTDELVTLLHDQPDALQGVLGHELGHIAHRDGLDLMVRASLIGAVLGVTLGDASGLLGAVPLVLSTQSYSRDAERAADAYAAQLLDANGIRPAAMAVFFERMAQQRQSAKDGKTKSGLLPMAIASHPDDAERIRFFSQWRRAP